jgi:hypothetical protein
MKLRPLPRSADTTGLTAGYGVIVRLDCTRNLRLLTHEFVHVAEYERLGREGFLSRIHSTNRRTRIPGCPFRIRGGSEEQIKRLVAVISALVDQTDLRRSARGAPDCSGPNRKSSR